MCPFCGYICMQNQYKYVQVTREMSTRTSQQWTEIYKLFYGKVFHLSRLNIISLLLQKKNYHRKISFVNGEAGKKKTRADYFPLLCVKMNDICCGQPLAALGNCLFSLQSHVYCCAEERYEKKSQMISLMQKNLNLYLYKCNF